MERFSFPFEMKKITVLKMLLSIVSFWGDPDHFNLLIYSQVFNKLGEIDFIDFCFFIILLEFLL